MGSDSSKAKREESCEAGLAAAESVAKQQKDEALAMLRSRESEALAMLRSREANALIVLRSRESNSHTAYQEYNSALASYHSEYEHTVAMYRSQYQHIMSSTYIPPTNPESIYPTPPPSVVVVPPTAKSPVSCAPPTNANTQYFYLLRCQQGKYYGGVTNNVNRRYEQHSAGMGSEWTKIYRPIELLESKPISNTLEEDFEVEKLMCIYGVNNVRGGSYNQVTLPPHQLQVLKGKLNLSKNQCFGCGQVGHFIRQCPNVSVGDNRLVDDEEEEVVVRKKSPVMNCERCGRNTHLAEKCYAKTSYAGAPLPPKITVDTPSKIKTIPTIAVLPPKTNAMVDNSTCTRCGRNTHLAEKCYAKTTYAGAPLATDCGRCGRKYHSVCKAVTHVDGTTLDDMDQLTKATQSLHL